MQSALPDKLPMMSAISLVIWNLAAFCMVALDKDRAKKKKMRIRERTIFLWALCLGAVGVWAGMYTFRHKTQHKSFVIGIPLLIIINIASVYFLWTIGH